MNKAQKDKLWRECQEDLSLTVKAAYTDCVEFMPFTGEQVVKWQDMQSVFESIAEQIHSNIYAKQNP